MDLSLCNVFVTMGLIWVLPHTDLVLEIDTEDDHHAVLSMH